MHYNFYTTSENAWAGMLAAISTARESIYLEMYILEGDTTGYDFLSELERKARENVRVILVLDALGSFRLESAFVDRLRAAGVEVLFFSYWFRRSHRKILIVDEAVAFLGGVNIARRFAKWNDLQVRISGQRIVREVLRSFARVYHECGGKNPALLFPPRLPLLKKTRLWFIEHGFMRKRHALRKHYEEHINQAVHSITLVTPYLIPRRWLISCLHRAIARGVVVTIITPETTDYAPLDRINFYYNSLFAKLGARCLITKKMNHAKVMLVDEQKGTVGSHNIDTLSFDWNREAGVFFDDTEMVRDLAHIVDEWKLAATPFTAATHPPHWYDILLALCLRLVQPAP